MYDTESNAVRGQHANKNSKFFFINARGSVKIKVDDGKRAKEYILAKPYEALYVPEMLWKDMYDFSKDSVLLVLSDKHYDADEYVRDYDAYLKQNI